MLLRLLSGTTPNLDWVREYSDETEFPCTCKIIQRVYLTISLPNLPLMMNVYVLNMLGNVNYIDFTVVRTKPRVPRPLQYECLSQEGQQVQMNFIYLFI